MLDILEDFFQELSVFFHLAFPSFRDFFIILRTPGAVKPLARHGRWAVCRKAGKCPEAEDLRAFSD